MSIFLKGSVRMFDLRHLEHSTIIYEDPQHTPLLRLAWNKQDPNYLATVAMDACEVIILDVRVPCTPVARLNNHKACVNGIAWAPHSSCHICTAGKFIHTLILAHFGNFLPFFAHFYPMTIFDKSLQ